MGQSAERCARRTLRRLGAALMLGLAVLAPALAGAVAAPEREGQLRHQFDLYAGGIWVGEMVLDATVRNGGYVAGARLKTAGLVRAFFDASLVAETVGEVAGAALEPERFSATTSDDDDTQVVRIAYQDGAPARVEGEPALKVRDYSLDPADQGRVADPLTGALSAFAPRADGFCGRRIEMYDGQRRFALVLDPARPDGARMRCEGRYERIAGFKAKMMRPERRTIPFSIWFERGADGLWAPVRAVVPTDYVALSLVRRD